MKRFHRFALLFVPVMLPLQWLGYVTHLLWAALYGGWDRCGKDMMEVFKRNEKAP